MEARSYERTNASFLDLSQLNGDPQPPVTPSPPVGLVLAVMAFTFDDLIPREVRISSLAIMSLMTVAIVALWLLIVERLLRRCGRADG